MRLSKLCQFCQLKNRFCGAVTPIVVVCLLLLLLVVVVVLVVVVGF